VTEAALILEIARMAVQVWREIRAEKHAEYVAEGARERAHGIAAGRAAYLAMKEAGKRGG
jgi:hypothetical protein